MDNFLKGKLGWKGERGYSAYEIAVQNGFIGSEQDWLDTIGCPISSTITSESTNGTCAGSKAVYDLLENGGVEIPIIIDHVYTSADLERAMNIYLGAGDPATEEEMGLYDLNGDGKITPFDTVKIQNIINNHGGIIGDDGLIGHIKINKNGTETSVKVINDYIGTSTEVCGCSVMHKRKSDGKIIKETITNDYGVYINDMSADSEDDYYSTYVQGKIMRMAYNTQDSSHETDYIEMGLDGASAGINMNTNYNGQYGHVTITPYKIEVENSTKKSVITPTSITQNVDK